MSSSLEQLAADGKIKRCPVDKMKIRGWIEEIIVKVNNASRKENGTSTRLNAAYEAILFGAFVTLNAQGYRVDSSEGHHALAMEALARSLDYSDFHEKLLQTIRLSRNQMYHSERPTETQAQTALKYANQVSDDVASWIQLRYPALLKS